MSGRQLGSAVGFLVGSAFGVPQLGMFLGGMAGAAIAPDQIQGTKIGDVPAQRSQPGGAQAVILGTSLSKDCTVMSQGPDMIVKEKTQAGKGGGPEVTNEVLYRHFTIRVCRSSLAEDNAVQAIVAVYADGNLVYDVRPNSKLTPADNAKFLENWTFYYGGPTQGTDPTEESYIGVGNVSAHRQICRMVGNKINLSDYGNRIPSFEVVVSQCPVEPPNFLLVTGQPKVSGGPAFAEARATSTPEFVGIDPDTGADIAGATAALFGRTWGAVNQFESRYSTDNRKTWQPGTVTDGEPFGQLVGGPGGWLTVRQDQDALSAYVAPGGVPAAFAPTLLEATFSNGSNADARVNSSPYIIDPGNGKYYISGPRTLLEADTPAGPYVAIWDAPKEVAAGRDPNGASIIGWYDLRFFDGEWYAVIEWHFNLALTRYQVIKSSDLYDWTTFDVVVDVPVASSADCPAQLCDGPEALCAYTVGGKLWTNANGWASSIATGLLGPGFGPSGVVIEGGRRIAFSNLLFYCIGAADQAVTFDAGTLAVSDPIPLPIDQAVSIVAWKAYVPAGGGLEVPDAPGHYYDPITGELLSPSQDEAQLCATTLANVVRWICNRGQLADDEIDVSELEDIPVRGITLQTTGSCKAELEPIRRAHFIDPADFDSALRFRLRGAEDVDMVINPDHLVVTDDEEEENRIIGQEVEYSKRHHLEYLSLDLDYIRTTATSPDRTGIDASVVGESQDSINEVFSTQEGKYIAAIQHKQLWMSREGGRKFGTGLEYIQLVGASLVDLAGRRGRVDSYSIDLNEIWFDSVPYDRASAMRARVVAAPAVGPSAPPSQVRGPTISVVMNAPVLRDADDKAGIYWGACGPMRGWRGAQLQVSRDGGTTWENGPTIDSSAVMGELSATLPAASRYVQDNANTLSVVMYRTDAGIDSTDLEGLMAGRNIWAIQYPDGTVEIGQAQTGIETADRQWELNGLMRGRQDTIAGEHLAGAKFVLLTDAVRFVAIRPDDVGKTLKFRAVSLGTDPDDAEVQDVTFTTIESLREWQPYNVVVTPDGLGGYCVAWIIRARLGSSRTPVHSQWYEGCRVSFTIGDVVHTVDTAANSVCVDAAALVETFGPNHGIPTITVRARSRVATNDDDFDSPPGVPTTDPNPSYGAVIIGEPGDMYEGEPVLDHLGPTHNPPFQAYGGKTEERFSGEIVGNVTCQSSNPGAGIMVGIPLTAETRNAATEMIPTGPDVGPGGPFLITDSVTVAAKPTYSLMDELKPLGDKPLVTLVTSPPRTTKQITAIGLGGLKSRAGFSTGKRRCVLTIGSMPAGGRIAVGVLAAGEFAHLAPGTGGSLAYTVTGNGAFAIECDAATGAVTITEIGVGLVASGTLPLTYAYDGQYRFAWSANDALHLAAGATVHANMGNESWPDTPTVGFGGLPNADTIIPCGFDAAVGSANGYWLQGTESLTEAASGGISATSLIYAYSAFGKSTGKWRIGMRALSTSRRGFCKAGHTGLLGASGTADSIGFTDTRGPDGFVIETSFGGVFNRITIPPFFYYAHPLVYFAFDTDAGTLAIYVKVEVVAGDPTAVYELLTTLVGIPAGTWLPAGNGAIQLVPEIPEPATFNNWTTTR